MLVAPLQSAYANTDEIAEVEDMLQDSLYDPSKKSELLRQGLERIERGLKRSESDSLQQAQWLYNLWFYHFLNEDYGESIIALEKALTLLANANNAVDQTLKTLTELSYSLILIGRISESKNYLRRALVLALESNDNSALSSIYYSLGDAYLKTGKINVAQRYFEATLALEQGKENRDLTNTTILKLGNLARVRENYTEAIDKHRSALDYFSDKNPYRKVVAEIELSRNYLGMGDIEKSTSYARAAANNPIALTEQRLDAQIELLKAINLQKSSGALSDTQVNEARQLIKSIESSLKHSIDTHVTDSSRPVRQVQFAEVAMRYYSQVGNHTEVFRIGNGMTALITKIAAKLRRSNADYQAWMASVQPALNEYIGSLYLHDRSKIFNVLENIYGHSLALPTADNTDFLSQSFEAREIELFERYLRAESVLVDAVTSSEGEQQTARDQVVNIELIRLERQRDIARDAYLYTKDLGSDRPPVSLTTAVASSAVMQIPEDQLYLRFFVQEDVSFAVVVGQGVLEYHVLPPRSVVRSMIDDVHSDINGLSDRYAQSLSALKVLLPLDMIKRNSKLKKLVIVPDDAILSVPFSAINIADDDAKYLPLTARYQVVRAASMRSYYADQPRPERASNVATPDIVIVADPVFKTTNMVADQAGSAAVSQWAQGLERLPYTTSEAEDIRLIFQDLSVTTYLGAQATAAVLLSSEARTAKILHIATHGYFNTATPEIVGIAASPYDGVRENHNGFLSLSELMSKPYFGNLVIISGCETMRGNQDNGQGVQSMSRGFLNQGAGSVIGSLWEVSDRATAKFMASFYRNLKSSSGNSALALQAAKVELSKTKRYRAPKYWAGFVLESSNYQFDQKVFGF